MYEGSILQIAWASLQPFRVLRPTMLLALCLGLASFVVESLSVLALAAFLSKWAVNPNSLAGASDLLISWEYLQPVEFVSLLAGLLLLRIILACTKQATLAHLEVELTITLRRALFGLCRSETHGSYLERLNSQVHQFVGYLLTLVGASQSMLLAIGYTLLVVAWSGQLVWVFLGLLALILTMNAVMGHRVRHHAQRLLQLNQRLSDFTLENLRGYDDILAYQLLPDRHNRFDAINDRYRQVYRRLAWLRIVEGVSLDGMLFMALALVALTLFLSPEQFSSANSWPVFVGYVALFVRFKSTCQQSMQSLTALHAGAASVRSLLPFLAVGTQKTSPTTGDQPVLGRAVTIKIDRIGYGGPDVLSMSEFSLRHGEIVQLAGRNGTGKSTLIKALIGSHAGPSHITYGEGGAPLSSAAWYGRVTALFEESHFFMGSVGENLTNRHEGRLPVAQSYADRLGLGDRLRLLPQGYDTILSDELLPLSRGERQKLALIRALVMTADFLLLDDAFTYLDGQSRRAIAEILVEERGKRGVLMVSHTPEIPSLADRTLSIVDGRIETLRES